RPAHRARQSKRTKQTKENSEDDRHSETIHSKNVVSSGANKGFGNLLGQNGFPAQRQRPFQAQRFIFTGQTERQRFACPGSKSVRQGRRAVRRKKLPIIS